MRRPRERYELETCSPSTSNDLRLVTRILTPSSLLKNAFCKLGRDLDHVFAAVKDQKQPPVPQKIDDDIRRISMVNDEPERRSDRAGDERRIL